MNMFKFMFTFCLLFPQYVTPDDKNVFEYDPDEFYKQIVNKDGNFIMFYTPWCRHCKEFHPIWSELGNLINSRKYDIAIAQVDCMKHSKLCKENDITGYPTLLYYHKNSFTPVEYKSTRDLPSLTLFVSAVYTKNKKPKPKERPLPNVEIYSGMASLDDYNIEKFVSKGQHFVLFYVPWCTASQKLAIVWAEMAKIYENNEYLQIGRINCYHNEITCQNFDIKQYPLLLWIVNGRIMGQTDMKTLPQLQEYVKKMLLTENHDPEKFVKKKKALPVARISEETFETFLENELVYVNYFAPWCAHCMQLSPLWLKLGERFQNESRVIIADIDCAQSKTICEVEKINGLPTLILYKNKNIVNVEHGSKPLESLITLVNEHLHDNKTLEENENKENENKGDENKGNENKGNENKGDENKGNENKGIENKGNENKGNENKENENKGDENKGNESKGNENKGDDNKENENKGDENKGNENKGNENKETENKGNENKETENKGNENKETENKENENLDNENNESTEKPLPNKDEL
ncbi:thioredoxin domain-containing protein 5 homolog [Danaus plexippus]|uniref:thioredoxin domain-containing protein 5 homolog n=1 Tax=Danaus plexippus TaxID=13037 RepID=UPI002AB0032F|nr:thioredoxin domain-containing protein 5 homolog [Danaus plexippus]